MLNLEQLEADREKATIDKADLFDFYHDNWDRLVAEIKELRKPDDLEPLIRPFHAD